jgi:ribosomal protein S18 acetylase RimI-like enzyme
MPIRPVRPGDEEQLAAIFLAGLSGMTYLPEQYTIDETRVSIRDVVLPNDEVWVAEDDGRVVGFVGFGDARVHHLWVEPDYQNRGIGTSLLRIAMERCPDGLDLWVYQRNTGARRLYERLGFRLVELTSGEELKENEPNARYVWDGATGLSEVRPKH